MKKLMFRIKMIFSKKARIMYFAWKSGCDLDGDVVLYKGRNYYVHVFGNRVYPIS